MFPIYRKNNIFFLSCFFISLRSCRGENLENKTEHTHNTNKLQKIFFYGNSEMKRNETNVLRSIANHWSYLQLIVKHYSCLNKFPVLSWLICYFICLRANKRNFIVNECFVREDTQHSNRTQRKAKKKKEKKKLWNMKIWVRESGIHENPTMFAVFLKKSIQFS